MAVTLEYLGEKYTPVVVTGSCVSGVKYAVIRWEIAGQREDTGKDGNSFPWVQPVHVSKLLSHL